MKKGKRYVESAKLVDRTNLYDVDEAVSILRVLDTRTDYVKVLLAN